MCGAMLGVVLYAVLTVLRRAERYLTVQVSIKCSYAVNAVFVSHERVSMASAGVQTTR